jgi:hypothetical protein
LAALGAGLCLSWGASATELLSNRGFDAVGSNGTPVTHNGNLPVETAAASWLVFQPGGSGPAVSALLASTNPLLVGGGNMLRFDSSTGFLGSAASGVFQNASAVALPGSTGSMDLLLPVGQGLLFGFVCASGGFCAGTLNIEGNGAWTRYTVVAPEPVVTFGFALLTAQSFVLADNASVTQVPEPGALLLFPAGLAALAWHRRALRRRGVA